MNEQQYRATRKRIIEHYGLKGPYGLSPSPDFVGRYIRSAALVYKEKLHHQNAWYILKCEDPSLYRDNVGVQFVTDARVKLPNSLFGEFCDYPAGYQERPKTTNRVYEYVRIENEGE